MELRHLRYFVALAECLNFTKAAEKVHITQSTLSHQIRQLEDEVGTPLFERVGKRVVLSRAGDIFLGCAWKVLGEIDQGISELRSSPDALSGAIRIGATQTFLAGVLPSCLADFLQANPSVSVLVEELDASTIRSRLLDDEMDLGIGYEPKDETNLWFEPLYAEEMMLLVAASHPFAQRRAVRMVELHRQGMILLPQTFATRKMLDGCFKAAGAVPQIAVEMNSIAAMIDLVSRTGLSTIISSDVVITRHDVRRIHLENPSPIRTPGLLWKRNHRQSPATRSLASLLRGYGVGRAA